MKTDGFTEGQRVKVEFEGVIDDLDSYDSCMKVKTDDSFYQYVHVSRYPEHGTGAKVTPLAPANWPPQVGDIWEAEGREYFVRKAARSDRLIVSPDALGEWTLDPDELRTLSPVLVRRRGQ